MHVAGRMGLAINAQCIHQVGDGPKVAFLALQTML